MAEEEEVSKVMIGKDEFGGLIGGLAGNFLQDKIGGGAGEIIGGLLRGGGGAMDRGGGIDFGGLVDQFVGGGGGRGKQQADIGDLIGGLISGGGGVAGGRYGGGGGENIPMNFLQGGVIEILSDLIGRAAHHFLGIDPQTGRIIGAVAGNVIFQLGGKDNSLGENIPMNFLQGGVIEILSDLIGRAAHHFLGIDPQTGRIIGAVAGNVIFQLGGKDNSLGDIGKIILDNIISGKYRRKVEPYVPRDPHPIPRPPSPTRKLEALDFYAERDRCLNSQTLFEDPEFPADDSSLFYSRSPPKFVEWKRPGEIVRDPQLIAEEQSRFDVIQGELGDCWLMAGAANLTLRDELFYRVVPPDQSFTENYAGIFHFQFWHYGEWVDVVVDDRLPTSDGKLLYMHSREHNEFWSPLLEKAYAKLHGNYEVLKGGTTSEALEDMTGGLTEFVDLKQPPRNLLQMMFRGFEMGSLFGCSIEASPMEFEARTREGLVKGHAYSITGMRMIETPEGTIPLLRLRNPWGNEQEWNGDWSDDSELWDGVSRKQKKEMNLVVENDGEFWLV
ncbi:Calpain clp-1 [Toxocara canis]|uniref:Calpain clp-1 n=1 Tax=Toxocara canis TaxID=6265 RepID=A0A0B2VN55_TOXCA|nr:Calpain clp-1 [Toxocara canis]